MQFLYPNLLWALLALAIPIIIHLFYFRRFKKVPFTNVRFLKEIKEETSHRSRIKNLLVLAMRMLAFASLIIAFCYPFFQNSSENIIGRRASSIFLDNSFSMSSKTSEVTLLEEAKASARQIISSHKDDDLIQILTQDMLGTHQRWVNKEDALGILDDITFSPASRSLKSILHRQEQLFTQAPDYQHQVYWISDFQSQMMMPLPDVDTTYATYLLPIKSIEQSNVSLDSVWLAAPLAEVNENNPVLFKLTNRGNGNIENIRVSLQYDNQTKPIGTIDLGAGESKTDTFSLPVKGGGWQEATLEITDHPITFDDQFHIAFNVPDALKVLIIADQQASTSLTKALRSMDGIDYEFQNKGQVAYDGFAEYNLIILDGMSSISSGMSTELKTYQQSGGNVLFLPSHQGDINSYNSFFTALKGPQWSTKTESSKEVSRINTQEFVFNNVFSRVSRNIRLPKTQLSYESKSMGRGIAERLLTYRDGGVYLGKFTNEKGRLFVVNSPLDKEWNSLTQNAEIFIPMLYKMALSQSTALRTSYTIGEDNLIAVPTLRLEQDEKLFLDGDTRFIPGIQQTQSNSILTINDQIQDAGVFQLLQNDQIIRRLAFNHDRRESQMTFEEIDEEYLRQFGGKAQLILGENENQLASFLQTQREGKSYWRLLLVLSLIFLGLEQLLLRFWKT